MIDRLRELANRPVSQLPAGLVIAACALVIVLGAILLSRIGDPQPRPQAHPAPRAQDADPEGDEINLNAPAPSWDYGFGELPSAEGPNAEHATPEDGARIRTVTRRFVTGYLAFTYQHGDASEIQGATPELLERLAQDPPRVPGNIRRRDPRVELVHSNGIGDLRAAAVAIVTDGAIRYSVHVRLIRNGPREWTVTDVTTV